MYLNYVCMFFAAFCLGTVGLFVKFVGDAVPITTLTFLRALIGFLTLLLIVPFIDKEWYKLSFKDAKGFFFLGLIFATTSLVYLSANLLAPVQNAVLINYSQSFFVLIFSYIYLKEKITKTKIITILIAVAGLAIINPFQQGPYMFGNLLALLSAALTGIFITTMRKENQSHTIRTVLWFFLFATILLSPFPIIHGLGEIGEVWKFVLLLGVLSSGFAYIFYNLALEKIEAEIGTIIATIITPLISVLLANWLLGEPLNPQILLGGSLLIIAGVYLQAKLRKDR